MLRYSLASVVSVVVTEAALLVAFGLLHWPASLANVMACAVGAVPSYWLNRTWTWGRRGRSRLWREVVPFFALAFLGLAVSTWATDLAGAIAQRAGASHLVSTLAVMSAALAAFGILWIGKFLVFDNLLFGLPVRRGEDAAELLEVA